MTKYFTKHESKVILSVRVDFHYLGFGFNVWRYHSKDDGNLNWGIELNLLGVTIAFQDNNY